MNQLIDCWRGEHATEFNKTQRGEENLQQHYSMTDRIAKKATVKLHLKKRNRNHLDAFSST